MVLDGGNINIMVLIMMMIMITKIKIKTAKMIIANLNSVMTLRIIL